MKQEDLDHALHVFGLAHPLTHERLEEKRRELLATWHPPRYANLTNNPRKFMQMYKQGEVLTKEVQEAYRILTAWLASGEDVKS